MNHPSDSRREDFPATRREVPHPRGRSRRGYSLVEMTVALTVLGVLMSMGIPRFQQSLEQTRADLAGANLRAIWSAQRLYWLENRTYAADLHTLEAANLVEPSLATETAPYTYTVTESSLNGFTATATRTGSPGWLGGWTIAADGTLSGEIQQAGHKTNIVPGFQ